MLDPTPVLPERWTRDHVGIRLVDAFRTLDRLPRVAGPRHAGNHWPQHTIEFADEVSQAELPQDERRRRANQRLDGAFRPSGKEIDRMDQAFDWLRDLYAADPDLAHAASRWALCAARRRSLQKLCREKGWVAGTLYLRRNRALELLAATLNARTIAVF